MNSIKLSKYHCTVLVSNVCVKKSAVFSIKSPVSVCVRRRLAWSHWRSLCLSVDRKLSFITGDWMTCHSPHHITYVDNISTSSMCLNVVTINSLCGMSLSCWADVKLCLRLTVVLSFFYAYKCIIFGQYNVYKLIQIKSPCKTRKLCYCKDDRAMRAI